MGSGGIPRALSDETSLGIDMETETGRAEKALLLREIVKDLFKWYDKDGEGAIDCNGLIALMSDLVVEGEVSLAETNTFMEEIDKDGDRLLQENELVEFMMERWGSSAPQAARFGGDVGAFLSVVYPIVQRKLLTRWRNERGIPEPPSMSPP